MSRDDRQLAAASKALRRRLGISQTALVGAGRSRHIPAAIEDGNAGRLRVDDVRAHFAQLGAAVRLTAWYEGALLDRLIDTEHADVVEGAVRELRRHKWPVVETEVSFNYWGERGSVDFLGANEAEAAILIGEAKSAWGSVEETLRALDVKLRLAPRLAYDRLGWRPRSVGALLVFPEAGPTRRIAQRYSATLLAAFPARNRAVKDWLRKPDGPLRGLWFLPVERHGVLERSDAPVTRSRSPELAPTGTQGRPSGRR